MFNVSRFTAFCAYSFDHQVGRNLLEAFGQLNIWHLTIVEAIGLLASLTVEVGMYIFIVIVIVAVTDLISGTIGVSFDDMHKPMLLEETECTEDVRLVDGENLVFQLSQCHRTHSRSQFPDYDDTISCRLNAVLFK